MKASASMPVQRAAHVSESGLIYNCTFIKGDKNFGQYVATMNDMNIKIRKELKEVNSDDEVIRDAGKQLKIAGQLMAWGGAATAIGTLLTTFGEPVSGGLIGLGGVILTYTGYGKIEKAGRIMAAAGK
jgi:hypothetical protein